jgi:hypothetical protein
VFKHQKKLLAGICLLFSFSAFSQKYRNGITEFGLLVGASNYFGDIAPEIVLKESNLSLGFLFKYHHSKFFSSRYQFTYAKISGDDKNFKANSYRNIKFESNIFELGYFTEFNFKPFGINVLENRSTFFVFSGVNMFLFNPTAKLPSGDKVDLRDFGTEGQKLDKGKQYSLIQPAFTLGLGYKFNVKRSTVIGIEIGFRKTFTDYLDDTKGNYPDYNTLVAAQGGTAGDLSQPQTVSDKPVIAAGTMRGDPHLNDWYFVAGITISLRDVTRDPCPGPR